MISADVGAILFYAGLFLMSLGLAGLVLHRWETELKQMLPRYQKRNRVDQGEDSAV